MIKAHSIRLGLKIDRDLNAAKNLANYSPTPKFEECEAFGEGSSVSDVLIHSPSVNEELNNFKSNNLKF